MQSQYCDCMHADAPNGNTAHAHGGGAEKMAYSVKNAADALDIGERTIWHLIATNQIASVKIGKSRRIPRAALEAYMQGLAGDAS
jgi:excisionase family DNA binding protein